MDCKFIWFNLPNKIKEVIAPYSSHLSNEVNKVTWFNLPNKLNNIYEEIYNLKTCIAVEPSKFTWFDLPNKLQALCDLVGCEEEPQYNFDITSSNWGSISDAESFKVFLESESPGTTAEDFSLESGRLRCNISNCMVLFLESLNITHVEKCTIAGLEVLILENNQIVDFNPTIALPSSLNTLNLENNQIVDFNPTIALPSSLTNLYLSQNQIVDFNPTIALPSSLIDLSLPANQIVDFNPTIALPSSLTYLELVENQIVEFNPTIALPSSLSYLRLNNNQIVDFNPTIALPSSLNYLFLDNNQIVNFNPTIALPSSLTYLRLSNNQMTLAGYTASEAWATAQPSFTSTCSIYFNNNIDSVSGTTLQTILLTKNCNVIA